MLNQILNKILNKQLQKAIKLNLSITKLLINDLPVDDSTFEASYYIRYISIINQQQNGSGVQQTIQQTFDQLNPWLFSQKLFQGLPEAPADFGENRIQQIVQQTPFGMLPQTQTINTDIKWQYLYQEVKNYLENRLVNITNNQNNVFVGTSSDITSIKNTVLKQDVPVYLTRKAISLLYYGNMVRPQTNFVSTCQLGILFQQMYEEMQKSIYSYFQYLVGELITQISQEQTIQLQDYISALVVNKNLEDFTKFLLTATRPCLLTSILYQTQEVFNLSDQIYQLLDKKQVFLCQQKIQQDLIENLQKELTKNTSSQLFIQKLVQMSWNDAIDSIQQEFVRIGYFNTEYQVYGASGVEIIPNQQQAIELMNKILLQKLQALADIQLNELLLTKQVPYMQNEKCYQISLQLQWLYMLTWYNVNQETKDCLIQLLLKVDKQIGYQTFEQLASLQDSLLVTFLTDIPTYVRTLIILVNRSQQFTQQLAQLALKYWNECDDNILESLCEQLTLICQQKGQSFIYQVFNANLQLIVNKCNQNLNNQVPCRNLLHLATAMGLTSQQNSKQNMILIKRCDVQSISAALLYLNDFYVLQVALQRCYQAQYPSQSQYPSQYQSQLPSSQLSYQQSSLQHTQYTQPTTNTTTLQYSAQYTTNTQQNTQQDQELMSSINRILYTMRTEEIKIPVANLVELSQEIVTYSSQSPIDWRSSLLITFQMIQIQEEFQEVKFQQNVVDFICQQINSKDQLGIALILQFYGFNCQWFNEIVSQQKLTYQPQNQFESAFNQLIQQLQTQRGENGSNSDRGSSARGNSKSNNGNNDRGSKNGSSSGNNEEKSNIIYDESKLAMNNLQQEIEKIVKDSKDTGNQLFSVRLQKIFLKLYILINQMPQWQRPTKMQLLSAGVQNSLLDIAIAGVDDEDDNIRAAILAIKKAIE